MIYHREQLEANERLTLAPYAALAADSRGRIYPESESKHRTAFQKDRDRIIHTTAFRRLEYKTQVFVNMQGDYYRTRLTHTLEVAQVAKSIARALGLNEDLAETIALAHDLGHPPFGHAGERSLNRLAKDVGGFDHNKQSLRVVTELERRYKSFDGLNLSWETLEGIMKHETEYDAPDASWEPDKQASLEAQVVNLADEFAYNAHDLDDGLRSGHITVKQIATVPIIAELITALEIDLHNFDDHDRYLLVRELLGITIQDCIEHTQAALEDSNISTIEDVRNAPYKITAASPEMRAKQRDLKTFLYQNFYYHYRLIRMTNKADHMLERIFVAYLEAPEMLPDNVQVVVEKKGLMRAITDYIAGMTDRYANDEYSRLFDPRSLT